MAEQKNYGIVCAVADCKNVGVAGSSLSFHRFPKDPPFRKAWIVKCKREDKFNPLTARICSEHFSANDYDRDLKNELLGLPLKRRLKTGSIPSFFPRRLPEGAVMETTRQQRLVKRDNRKTAKSIIEDVTGGDHEDLLPSVPSQEDFSCQVNMVDTKLHKDNSKLRKQVKDLQIVIKNLRRRLRLKADSKKMTRTKTFSSAQIKKMKGQRRVNWGTDDIVKALSLRSISLKAYETARTSWNLPLPAPSTLRTWVHRFQCTPGIQSDVIRILGEHTPNYSNLSRICSLTFDEMSLDGRYELDPVYDQLSCFSKVQVVMARGIVENWKQPIYFNYDTAMTVGLLNSIISQLESSNIKVVSMTSDLGGENRRLWKLLNITPEKPYFFNPFNTNRKIFVFADMPHLLKLIRNHLIDDGVMTQDGVIIDKGVLQTLVDTDCEELKLCPKLSQSLVDVTGVERMRVRPAAQLLSRHTSVLAKLIFPDSLEIGNFIQTINDGFDVFNSRCHINERNPILSAFGVNIEKQTEVLTQLKHLMSTSNFYMKTNGKGNVPHLKTALLPCQIGYLVSIESLQQLYQSLKVEFNLDYLITCRVNQDCLESFFSRIRGFGGPNPNPTPSEFRYRFRLILLGGTVRAPKGSNPLEHCSSSYVSADLLDKNNINVIMNVKDNQFDPKSLDLSDKVKNNLSSSCQSANELDYLAGYIAWCLKRKCPTLPHYGAPTGKLKDSLSQSSWIQMLSRGGLLTPNLYMKSCVTKCNSVFESAISHLQNMPNLHQNLQKTIEHEFPDIERKIIHEFVKIRIKIRVKHLNVSRVKSMTSRKMKSVLSSFKGKI